MPDGEPKAVFVTGGTGFIGSWLVQALLDAGHRVRALSRRANPPPPPGWERPPLAHPRAEIICGDITDRRAVLQGMEGCTQAFHLAGYAKNWAPSFQTYYDLNVQGLLNVLDAARQLPIERVVWTSTVVTMGPSQRGEIRHEDQPRGPAGYFTEYEQSKALAEREAAHYIAEGVPLVIVNPTRVFGPGHLTEGNALTQLIDDYDRGRFPLSPNLGRNVANYAFVHDVVQGLLLAMERGRVGQRYVLGGENASLREFLRCIDLASGKRHWHLPVFRYAMLAYAGVLKKCADWFGVYPRITPGWVRTFLVDWAYSTRKAEEELGYRPTPLREAIQITYDWLIELRSGRREAPQPGIRRAPLAVEGRLAYRATQGR